MNYNFQSIKTLTDLKDKRVILRVDFNVPLENSQIVSDFKIRAAIPTIECLLAQHAQVILVSHLGRPAGEEPELSLRPVAEHLSELLDRNVEFINNFAQAKQSQAELILLENIRFDKREIAGDKSLAGELAQLGEYFIFDAFAVAHRQHTSTYYLADELPTYAGLRFEQEVEHLSMWTQQQQASVVIMGGAKISTKLPIIVQLLPKVEYILVGGGVANNFLKAAQHQVGQSLVEDDLIERTADILDDKIIIPQDVVVADKQGNVHIKSVSDVNAEDKIYDLGPETIQAYEKIIQQAQNILWNGPLGYFEKETYAAATFAIAKSIANTKARQTIGGGETLQVVQQLHLLDKYDFVSTGGGAMLEFIAQGKLPIMDKLN